MQVKQNTQRRQHGSALVEFALMVPCLLLLMLVVSEGASVVATHQIINNAAREGVRLAVTPGELGDNAGIDQRVISYAAANGLTLSAANVSVNQALSVNSGGGACSVSNPCLSASQVTVSYSDPLNYLPKLPFGIPNAVPLSAAVEMRNFY